jgi:hypothetical protein
MSLLAGHTFVLQADREKLLDLIQSHVMIAGTPIQAPFRLRIPRPNHPILGGQTDAVDIIVKSVRLMLEPGGKAGRLVFGIEAGVVRMGSDEVPFTSGELQIAFEFQDGTLLSIKLLSATLHGVAGQLPDFAARANAEVNKLLDNERNHVFPLFDELDDEDKILLALSKTRVVDSTTVGVFLGSGGPAQVDRAIGGGSSVSFALAADFVTTNILCRTLLQPQERDPEWRQGGPTDLERTKLPAPCGTGQLSRGGDGFDIRIKELNFSFADGFLDITGKFDAGDDDCWEVNDGSLSQRLFFDFNPVTQRTMPRLDPPEPTLNFELTLRSLCKLAQAFLGAVVSMIGQVLLLWAQFTVPEIVRQLLQPSPVPTIASIRWGSVAIALEGLLLQGEVNAERFSDAHQPSRAWMSLARKPANVKEGAGGEALYQAPMCEPDSFKYRDFSQDDIRVLRGEPEWLVDPVSYQWFVNGIEIPHEGGSPLKFATTVRTAVPPPDGDEVAGYAVELGYDFGMLLPLVGRSMRNLTLTPRAADLRYSVRVEMKVTDGAGRVYWDARNLDFEGVWAEFGEDYDDYREECFKRVRDVVDKKSLIKRRLKPGEPQEEIDWIARYIQEYVEAGSPELATVIETAVKMQGLAAVNKALAEQTVPG